MSFAAKHNKGSKFDIDITDWPYKKLEDLFSDENCNKPIKIQGMFISTKGMFGDQPILICDGFCVNLPAHMTDECKNILLDSDDIETIKNGKVGFTIEQYVDKKFNKTCYGIRWCDL